MEKKPVCFGQKSLIFLADKGFPLNNFANRSELDKGKKSFIKERFRFHDVLFIKGAQKVT